jgi:hypothetical protein
MSTREEGWFVLELYRHFRYALNRQPWFDNKRDAKEYKERMEKMDPEIQFIYLIRKGEKPSS